MTKPLDGVELLAYCHRLHFPKETQKLLMVIRDSPPSRTPRARLGNMPVWYPSKKMQCIIKAESTKVEFPFLLQAEYDQKILEVWDQPPSIQLEYLDRRGYLQRPLHTADYFLFQEEAAGWVECKPLQELYRLAEKQPNRYKLDEQGVWRCPPGETFAAQYGLTYEVWPSDRANWVRQDNILYLEDYHQDLDQLVVPGEILERLYQIVEQHAGITLTDLRKLAFRLSEIKGPPTLRRAAS